MSKTAGLRTKERLPRSLPRDGMIPAKGLHAADIEQVRASFRLLALDKDRFAEMFFARLLVLEPDIRREWHHTTIARQRSQLFSTLGEIIARLDTPVMLESLLYGLCSRHAIYGGGDRRYRSARLALAWTIDRLIETGATRAAWDAAFDLADALLGRPTAVCWQA